MKVSVIVCTWNRAQTLVQVLEGLASQTFDRDDTEVIVVDNNSSDATRGVVSAFAAGGDMRTKYVFEEKQGLSQARNRGIKESNGEVVAFLDDDAVPEPDWLGRLVEPYGDPQVGCVGGRVLLRWPQAEKPSWLTPIFHSYYAAYGWEAELPVAVCDGAFPYGANISFRRRAVEQAGLFRTDLGFRGASRIAGEETELCGRIHRDEWKIMFAPGAVVQHLVGVERLEKDFLLSYARTQGISNVIMDWVAAAGIPIPLLLPRYLVLLAKHLALFLKNAGREDWRFFFWLYVVRETNSVGWCLGNWRLRRVGEE